MKYLTILLGFLATLAAAFGFREKSKREKQEADLAKQESESLSRQSEAAFKRTEVQNEKIIAASKRVYTADDINRLWDSKAVHKDNSSPVPETDSSNS